MPQAPKLPPDAAVVIPVYNHGRFIEAVLERARLLGAPIYVVDDGSTDDAPRILAGRPDIIVLTHQVNLGKGAALMTGFKEAAKNHRWAATIDADGQHDPREAPRLFEALLPGQRALVIGDRTNMLEAAAPWTSRWGRRFSNFWVYLAAGVWTPDSQSGFRLYPLPEALELGVASRRFQFEIEVIARAAWRGIPVKSASVSVVYPPGRRVSHFRPWVDFWRNTKVFARLITRRVFTSKRRRGRA